MTVWEVLACVLCVCIMHLIRGVALQAEGCTIPSLYCAVAAGCSSGVSSLRRTNTATPTAISHTAQAR